MEKHKPKLRFPEFDVNWESKTLGEIGEFIGGGTPSTANEDFWNGNINWFTPTEIKKDYVDNSLRKISEQGLLKSSAKLLPLGTILLTTRATIGDVAITKSVCSTNQGFQSLVTNELNNNYFILNWFKKSRHLLMEKANGSTFPEISKSAIEKISLFVPNYNEQTKIGNFLSAVDEKLNLLKEKKELLADYKKGIMQKIFIQEIRFKDDNGNDFEDWIETNLGGICEFENGKAHENEIDENGDFVVVNSKFVSTNGRVRKYTNKIISRLDKNDIVMVMSDVPNGKAIAKCYYIEEDNKYSLNQRICKIRVVNNDSKYIYYLINRNPYYLAFDSGVGQTNLKKDEVLDCPLYIPKNVKEQTKIANFLSAIDEKIELVSNQIQDTQDYKKGLLQQMFI